MWWTIPVVAILIVLRIGIAVTLQKKRFKQAEEHAKSCLRMKGFKIISIKIETKLKPLDKNAIFDPLELSAKLVDQNQYNHDVVLAMRSASDQPIFKRDVTNSPSKSIFSD